MYQKKLNVKILYLWQQFLGALLCLCPFNTQFIVHHFWDLGMVLQTAFDLFIVKTIGFYCVLAWMLVSFDSIHDLWYNYVGSITITCWCKVNCKKWLLILVLSKFLVLVLVKCWLLGFSIWTNTTRAIVWYSISKWRILCLCYFCNLHL